MTRSLTHLIYRAGGGAWSNLPARGRDNCLYLHLYSTIVHACVCAPANYTALLQWCEVMTVFIEFQSAGSSSCVLTLLDSSPGATTEEEKTSEKKREHQ